MRESENLCANYLTKFSIDLDRSCILQRLIDPMSLILNLSRPVSVQVRESNLGDFFKNKNDNNKQRRLALGH